MTIRAINDENYEHVLNVSKAFKINTTKDSHVLYLKVNVLLLACVFETFRKKSTHFFWNRSCSYLSGYGWDALLKFTDANLKLIWGIEKYQFIEKHNKSGISIICKGYAEANNQFLKSYKANKPASYIIYLDARNLYGYSIMQLLPTELLD